MKLIYANRSKKEFPNALQVTNDQIFEKSDIISLNCPLNKDSKHIINEISINKMKRNVILLNSGRGPLVDEDALSKALNENRIGWYASDVLSTEPPKKNNPLIGAKNCFITPHIAWQTSEARTRLMEIAVNNIKCFLSNNPINRVKE